MKPEVLHPFIVVGYRKIQDEYYPVIRFRTANLPENLSPVLMGNLIAALTRGISEVIRETNNLPKGELEQIECKIVETYLEEIKRGGENEKNEWVNA